MASSASDLNDLKLALNPAKRRALTILIGNIVSHMRSKVEQAFDPSPAAEIAPLFVSQENTRDTPFDPEEAARQRRLEARIERSFSTPKLQELKRDALIYFDKWSNEVRRELRKVTDGPEDPRSEQRRREWLATRNPPPPAYTPNPPDFFKTPEAEAAAMNAETKDVEEAKAISAMQSLYYPLPTRLTTISKDDRTCVISCMVLLLLSLGHYSAHSRTLLCYITSSFALPLTILTNEETEIARTLLMASKTLTADAETKKRQAENASARRWKVGLASVAGAAVIGITGGLAAPVVAGAIGGLMGGVGLGGVASFLGIFAMNGALVGTLFGAFGGKMTGEMVDAYAKEVSDFNFLPIVSEWGELTTKPEIEAEARRLRVTIGINGWLNTKDDVIKPWRVLGKDSEVFALRYEMDALLELGNSLKSMVSSYAWSYVKVEILKRTVLATLWSALWPVYLLKMATSIDNPFAVARNRSEKAGEVLADALINKAQGERPVTLIGYSLGARVIYSCLKSLAERRAFGLVESVVFIGAPVPSNADNWRVMRSVVSGKIFNVFSEKDYILAFMYRATSIQFGVAGLQEINTVEGINNLNLSSEVSGHLRYPELVGKILKRVGVESVLIEDADIENDAAEIKLVDDEDLIDFGEDDVKDAKVVEMDPLQSTSGVSSYTPIPRRPVAQPQRSFTMHEEIPVSVQETASSFSTMQLSSNQTTVSNQSPQSNIRSTPPPQPTNIRPPPPEYDSEDEGVIQMVDNDSDYGELEEIPSVPIPDDDEGLYGAGPGSVHGPNRVHDDSRNMGKDVFEEGKSLGSFPNDRRAGSGSSPSGSGSGSGVDRGRGRGSNANADENEENTSGQTRVSTAWGMGLY